MMKEYYAHNESSPHALYTLTCSEDDAQLNRDNGLVLYESIGLPSSEVYIHDGTPTPRPENPTTLDGLTLSDVPVPAVVLINGQRYETNEPTIELEFDQVGVYTIRVESFPYLPKEFQIEINE